MATENGVPENKANGRFQGTELMYCNDCSNPISMCECSPFGGRRREAAVAQLRDESYKALTRPPNHNTPALDAAVDEYLAASYRACTGETIPREMLAIAKKVAALSPSNPEVMNGGA